MSLKSLIIGAAPALLFCACAPAAQQSVELPQDTQTQDAQTYVEASSHMETRHSAATKAGSQFQATVKPGADIKLNSVLPKVMTSGGFQTVELEFSDGYQDGVMTVDIVPSEGLSLFGGSNTKTFNLATPGPHVWKVDVKADVDGVYFLNVFSEAKGMPRSFSVRLNIGVVTQKMINDAIPAQGKLTDGGKIRV